MALDATVGGSSANSYVSDSDASTYFANRPQSDSWTALTTAQQEAALIAATRMVDRLVPWYGSPSAQVSATPITGQTTQALRWPRTGVLDMDQVEIPGDVIPQGLKDAVCELAFVLAQDDRMADNGLEGFQSVDIGSIRLHNDPLYKKPVLPRGVKWMLMPYGQVASGVKLQRC